jgi:hypothetical protein
LHFRVNVGPQFWELQRELNLVTIFPQCPRNKSYWSTHGPNPAIAIAILDKVAEKYGTDPDRVYLTGLSSGGAGTMDIISVAPERFAAALPMSQGYFASGVANDPAELAKIVADNRIPVWSQVNEGDKRANETSDDLHLEMLKLGLSPRRTARSAGGHAAWGWGYRNPAMWDWLLKQSRANVDEQAQGFRLMLHEGTLDGWTATSGDWQFDDTGPLQVSSTADGEPSELLMDQSLSDFDLHFEVSLRGTARADTAQSQFSIVVKGLRLVVSAPIAGGGGLMDPKSGEWIASNDPLAERELFLDRRYRGWNEVRLRVQGDRLTLELNGWPALDVTDPRLAGPGKVGLAADMGQELAWRYVRMREIEK